MNKPNFTKKPFTLSKDFKVRISQIPAMDVAFETMAMSEYELLVATIYKLNELIGMTNSYTELIDEILKWVVGDGLEQTTKNILVEWLNDGTLEVIINDALFNQKLDKDVFNDFVNNTYEQFKTNTNQEIQNIQATIDDEIIRIDDEISRVDDEISRVDDEISRVDGEISRVDGELEDLETNKADKEYLDSYFVSVKQYGAVGDGISDDTLAFQTAINEKKPLKIPEGEYLITDSLNVYKNTTIFGTKSKSNYYGDALVKIKFVPTTKKDLFITTESVVDPINNSYIYGISIGGFSINGVNGGYVFNLPKMSNIHLYDIAQYGGFDYGILVDGWIDSNVERCSFQGTEISAINVIVTHFLSTTVTFRKCYFSQGNLGLSVSDGAVNSLVFDNCVFESLASLANINPENNVIFNDLYVENIPRYNVGYVFNLGIEGLKTSPEYASLIINGAYIQGYISSTVCKFINADWFKLISLNNVVFEYFNNLLEFSTNTECVSMSGCFTYGVTFLGASTNNWNVVTTSGCNFKYTGRDNTFASWIGTHNLEPKRVTSGNPNGVVTPTQIGDEILDTSTNVWYKSHGTTINDWKALN